MRLPSLFRLSGVRNVQGETTPVLDINDLDIQAAKQELVKLRAENETLRALTNHAIAQGPGSRSGYLYRHVDWSSGLFAGRWDMQYFVLVNGKVMQFTTEKDVGLSPKGYFDLERCCVEVEGPKKNHFYVFSILTDSRETLLRLSTESKSDMNRWLDALEAAGCAIASLASESQPSRPPSVAASAAHGNGDVGDTATSGAPGAGGPAGGVRRRGGRGDADAAQEADGAGGRGAGAGPGATGRPPTHPVDGLRHQAPAGPSEPPAKVRFRRGMTGATPVHRELKFSLLSSERLSYEKHAGLINLGMVVIIATHFRLILENLLKYGIRFRPWDFMGISSAGSADPPPLLLMASWPILAVCPLLALAIERLLASALAREHHAGGGGHPAATERLGLALNFLNTSLSLVLPCYAIYRSGPRASPLPAFVLVFAAVIVWMKLVSYAHCNADCRDARRRGELVPGERGSDEEISGLQYRVRYPEQLTVRNMAYFMAAPTLCYQLSYPSSSRIRLRWLIRRVLEVALYAGMMGFLLEQYVEPAIANSMRPMEEMDWIRIVERVLKLALPMLYVWLCMFYVFFHLWLNILAEVLRFGDRVFYMDWWNATTFEAYWRLWNIPVHRWMLRTVYYPAVRRRVPRTLAMVLVFFVSAVLHELVVGVPLHMVRAWAFAGILGQVPLIVATNWLQSRIKSEQLGNVVFWITFCFVGQPISVLFYYHDYIIARNRGGQSQLAQAMMAAAAAAGAGPAGGGAAEGPKGAVGGRGASLGICPISPPVPG